MALSRICAAGLAVLLLATRLTAAPIAHWALNETAAGPAVDSVGGFNGINNGALIGQPGAFGTAYDFNGTSSNVNIGHHSAFDFNFSTPFTLSAWVRRENLTGTQAIVGKTNSVAPFDGWLMSQRDLDGTRTGRLDFSLGNTSNRILVDSTTPIPFNQLSHVAVTYDGSGNAAGVKMYIDGIPTTGIVSQNNPTLSPVNTQPVNIGSYAGANRFFNGLIDEVAVYSGALSFDQIQVLRLQGVTAFNAGAGASGVLTVNSFNGSYLPSSETPPAGQTIWSVHNAGIGINPNSPAAGITNLNDATTTARVSFFDQLTDIPLVNRPWTMEARLRVNSLTGSASQAIQGFLIGVRDEGIAGGKNGALVFAPDGRLYLGLSGINGDELVSTANFLDGQFHTYRVEKFEVDGDYFVQVFIDGIAQFGTPLDYADLANQVGIADGIGFFSSTAGTSNVDLDYLTLNVPFFVQGVPEPASLALWSVLGLAVVALWKRRRN